MELNIKRFASAGNDELYPDYSYDYTPNGYIRTATVTIVCEYDISSVFLVQGGDEINDTENWIITEDFRGRPCAKRYFHEPVDATYNIYCENNETPFSVSVDVANDFQPESEQYPIILNHDVKISDSNTKLKNVADVVENYFDYIYPIGSVYKSASAINPQNILLLFQESAMESDLKLSVFIIKRLPDLDTTLLIIMEQLQHQLV